MILCYNARNKVHTLDETLAFSILLVDWPIVWWPNLRLADCLKISTGRLS